MIKLTSITWALPFLVFVGGYWAALKLVRLEEVPAPALVGLPLQDALLALSSHHLYGELVRTVEDASVPSGTVTAQDPLPGQLVKVHHPVACVVATAPALPIMGSCVGYSEREAVQLVREHGLQSKVHYLEHVSAPEGTCFAQYPATGAPVVEKYVHLYIARAGVRTYVMPDFRGQSLACAQEALAKVGLTGAVAHSPIYAVPTAADAHGWVIEEQVPRAGASMSRQGPAIRLYVSPRHDRYTEAAG